MEKIKITKLHGVYYKLSDCYGEIETSRSYDKIKELYDTYKDDKYLQEEMYGGCDMQLRIEKEVYEDGHYCYSEEVL